MRAIDKAMTLAMKKNKVKKEAASSFRITNCRSAFLQARKVSNNEVEISIAQHDGGMTTIYVPEKLFHDSLRSYLQNQV